MAKPPTLDEYIEALKVVLEFEMRRKLAEPRPAGPRLFTNEEAAQKLKIGISTWYRSKAEAGLKNAHTKRANKPLWSAEQVETVRRHLDNQA